MNSASPSRPLSLTHWLVILIAVIGFAFDTYELLLFPLIGGPAVAELLQLPANNPLVTEWLGKMLWVTALCGGVFGLLGGWLTDRFGRKTVLAASIALYSLSPAMAAMSTTIEQFVFFRCATFVGVCVEFVAAITWLAELFPDMKQREKALGWTQAFASIGGLMVTGVNVWILTHASTLAALPITEPFNAHASWRYLLLTGLLPALPIALLLPFVPESQVWVERRKSGTLRRPRFAELFSPALRRTTLVTAGLSACAYAAAFGALQLTPTRIVPGLPDLAEQRKALKPLQDEARALNQQLLQTNLPAFTGAVATVPALKELAGKRAKVRQGINAARRSLESDKTADEKKTQFKTQLSALTNNLASLDQELTALTAGKPEAKKAVIDREKTLGQLAANRAKQEPADLVVKARGNQVQLWQELGGLCGRIALALLLVTALKRGLLLRLFIGPGMLLFALTYVDLFQNRPEMFQWGVALCGFMTVAQFSYMGEFLPKVFPLHLRGTGGSFATNVGGRMIGTSAALVTTNVVAPRLSGTTFEQVATGAAIVGTTVFVLGFCLSFLLPTPKAESTE
ncbi:MAG: MFS transporter [Pedosphaera sp.]|nr:MFS transporter [Pedosphaera sp.]